MSAGAFVFATIAGPDGHKVASYLEDGRIRCQCGEVVLGRPALARHLVLADPKTPVIPEPAALPHGKIIVFGPHGITFFYDPKTDTTELAPAMRDHADRQLPDGTLTCLAEAREIWVLGPAHLHRAAALLCLVHYRAIEMRMPALVEHVAQVKAELEGTTVIDRSALSVKHRVRVVS